MNEVPVAILKPHPKNKEFFPDRLPDNIWRELVRDIRENGVINPLIITPDYTVLAGHLRLEAAQEAGLTHVPVVIRDVNPDSDEAVSLLIRDNLLRRQLSDLQVARLIRVLKERYGIRRGGDRRSKEAQESNCQIGSLIGVANIIGLPERTVYRLDRLNDLIPDLQALLESGRWSATTVASVIGTLPPEEQEQLFGILGETGVCTLSVKEAQELKRLLDAERRERESLQEQLALAEEEKAAVTRQLADLQDTLARAEDEISEKLNLRYQEKLEAAVADLKAKLREREEEIEQLRARLSKPVERVVEKVVYQRDPSLEAELEAARNEAARLLQEKERHETRLREVAGEKTRIEAKARALEDEIENLQRHLDHARRELEKERTRPRPRFDQRRENFRGLAEKARKLAFDLADTLRELEEGYADELLAAARVRGGPDVREIAEATVDAGIFKTLDVALQTVAGRLNRIFDLVQAGKPALRVVKRE